MIYDETIKCLERLIEIQKKLKTNDGIFIRSSLIDGNSDKNAWSLVESLNDEYKNEYIQCEKIIRPNNIAELEYTKIFTELK